MPAGKAGVSGGVEQAAEADENILSPRGERGSIGSVPPEAVGLVLYANPQTRRLLNEKDRFGFPLHTTLLEAYDLKPELETLARDAVETLSRLLGPDQARSLLLAKLRQPKKGKQANQEENAIRLAAYGAELAAGVPKRLAARCAAEKLAVKDEDPESVAKQIRGLVKARDTRRARTEAWCKICGPSLLERAISDPKTEL